MGQLAKSERTGLIGIHAIPYVAACTEVKLFIGSKVECFLLKLALLRGEGEKRKVRNANKAHRTFDPRNTLSPENES